MCSVTCQKYLQSFHLPVWPNLNRKSKDEQVNVKLISCKIFNFHISAATVQACFYFLPYLSPLLLVTYVNNLSTIITCDIRKYGGDRIR